MKSGVCYILTTVIVCCGVSSVYAGIRTYQDQGAKLSDDGNVSGDSGVRLYEGQNGSSGLQRKAVPKFGKYSNIQPLEGSSYSQGAGLVEVPASAIDILPEFNEYKREVNSSGQTVIKIPEDLKAKLADALARLKQEKIMKMGGLGNENGVVTAFISGDHINNETVYKELQRLTLLKSVEIGAFVPATDLQNGLRLDNLNAKDPRELELFGSVLDIVEIDSDGLEAQKWGVVQNKFPIMFYKSPNGHTRQYRLDKSYEMSSFWTEMREIGALQF